MALNVIGALLTRAGLLGNILSFKFGRKEDGARAVKKVGGDHKKGKRVKPIYIPMMGGEVACMTMRIVGILL